MTKETKIGLLVGLAFIILFAIILSEKGAGPRSVTTPQFTQADDSTTGAKQGERPRAPLAEAGRLPVETALPEPATPIRTRPTRREPPAKPAVAASDAGSSSSTDVTLPRLPESLITRVDQGPRPAATGGASETQGSSGTGDVSTSGGEPARVAASESPKIPEPLAESPTVASLDGAAGGARTLESMLDAITPPARSSTLRSTGRATGGAALTGEADTSGTVEALRGRLYEVRRGDTLSRIAEREYGSSTPSVIERIYRANARRMKDRHTLVAGQQIVLPEGGMQPAAGSALAGSGGTPVIPLPLEEKTAEARPKPSAEPTPAEPTPTVTKKTAKAERWYEVRPRDSLSRIAREQLGDERRYREIFELNKGILSDQHRLRPGLKLRLPPRETTEARASRAAGGRRNLEVASR